MHESIERPSMAGTQKSEPDAGQQLLVTLKAVNHARAVGLRMVNGKAYDTGRGYAWASTLHVDGKKAFLIRNDGNGACSWCSSLPGTRHDIADLSKRLADIEPFGEKLLNSRIKMIEAKIGWERRDGANADRLDKLAAEIESLRTRGVKHDEGDLCELMELMVFATEEYQAWARKARKHLIIIVEGQPNPVVFKAADSPGMRRAVQDKYAGTCVAVVNDVVAPQPIET